MIQTFKIAREIDRVDFNNQWFQLAAETGQETGAGIFKQSMEARNQGGIGLSYRPARLHRLAEFIPWNRFLGSINV
jgi:hypothetical protein